MFFINVRNVAPIMGKLLRVVGDEQLTMEVNMGAAVSIIPESTLQSLLPQATLRPTDVKLTSYVYEQTTVLGELIDSIKYNQQKKTIPLHVFVVADEGPSLLGRNWMNRVRLDWKKI